MKKKYATNENKMLYETLDKFKNQKFVISDIGVGNMKYSVLTLISTNTPIPREHQQEVFGIMDKQLEAIKDTLRAE